MDLPVVLVVDNDAMVRRTIVRVLQSDAYELVEVDGATAATEAAQALGQRLRLVLIDWNLNGSGRPLLDWLRATCPWSRVMIITGAPDDVGDVDVQVVAKPYQAKILRSLVSSCVTS